MKLFTTLFLATSILSQAEVKLTVGDISDRRTNGQFFGGLEIELKLSGPEMAECKGLRAVVKDAKDDTGKAVPVEVDKFNDGRFDAPQKGFGGFNQGKEEVFQSKLQLKNPERSAKTLTLNGAVELLIPSKDPAGVVTVSVAKEAGKPLATEALKAAGVTITLKAIKDLDASYTIADPNKKVASVEFCTAAGKPLETNGWSSSGFGGSKDVSLRLRDKAPADVVAKIYLVTEKSVVSVPVKLEAVKLP